MGEFLCLTASVTVGPKIIMLFNNNHFECLPNFYTCVQFIVKLSYC